MFAERKSWPRRAASLSLLAGIYLGAGAAFAERTSPADSGVGSSVSSSDRSEHVEVISLELAEQTVLSAEGVRSYSEGARGVVDVRLTKKGDQFVLVGLEGGTTTLLFIMNDGSKRHYRIEVNDPQQERASTGDLDVLREDNIRLDFYFVQLSRSENYRMGVGYPDAIKAGVVAGSFDFLTRSFQSATAVVEEQALLRLDMAQAAGWAKLRRQAAVVTENGKRAEFSGGGEVNIPIVGSLATGIHSIDFGSTIEVLPRYDSDSGRIQVELKADVSDLTDDGGTGAPGRTTATLQTVVNVELGQTVVLAGLSSASKQKTRSGLPFLSQIPVLGYLFGSERMNEQEVENVVFIVPTVVDATTRRDRKSVNSALEAYMKYSGDEEERSQVRGAWEEGK
jgi:pilus assembly protein CpaC